MTTPKQITTDLPSSETIAEKMTQVQEQVISPVQSATVEKLSPTGRKVLDDTTKVMRETRQILQTKLRNNQVQELVGHSRILAQKLRGTCILSTL